ncbi:hypothetical protein EC973_001340 [Apophysomyces ossiformis]|uniref:BAG domain-containing protein n=1 Tax=Apophysomyces ossiformis TaxID=679940 RepID=A0A8H7BRN6_9FUNG|nr:hypothetical protein EC973_001340 [Apophysomyces ossiformis]
MYYTTTPLFVHPTAAQRIQRNLTLDDYLQLQVLLRHEQERREREQARQEQLRLQYAMDNLRYMTGQYRRERCRQIEQYLDRQRRAELLHQAYLEQERERAMQRQREYERAIQQQKEQEEEYYRQRLAAALEQQRVDRLHQQYLALQKQAQEQDHHHMAEFEPTMNNKPSNFREFHADRISPLVKLIFGQQEAVPEPEDEEKETPAQPFTDEEDLWRYMGHEPEEEKAQDTEMAETSSGEEMNDDDHSVSSDVSGASSSSSDDDSQPPVQDHVLNLKGLVNELVAKESVPESAEARTNPEISMKTIPILEDTQKTVKCEKLRKIEDELENIQKQHQGVFDTHLDFQKAESGTLLLTASTADNREFLGYEDKVMRIMLQLDTIESDGDEEIRSERKALVKRAEHILELLDAHKQEEWQNARRQQRAEGKKKRKQQRRKQSKHKSHSRRHHPQRLVSSTA